MRAFNLGVVACDSALAVVSSLYLAFGYAVAEYRLPYVPVCPFLLITGGPCPLCGSTRKIGALLPADLSLGWNDLPSLLWFAVVLSVLVVSIVRVVEHLVERSHRRVAMSNNGMQLTALRAAADAERWVVPVASPCHRQTLPSRA
jgi:hypothetical protein